MGITQISNSGLLLIANAEEFIGVPYMDTAGVWTIGYGHVILDANGQRFVGPAHKADVNAIYPQGINLAEAQVMLRNELRSFEAFVAANVAADTTQPQFDAFVSFSYNVGTGGMRQSSALSLHNAGKRTSPYTDAQARQAIAVNGETPTNAPDALFLWVKDHENGQLVTVNGLVNRRSAERTQYLSTAAADTSTASSGDPNSGDAVLSFWQRIARIF